MLQEIANNMYEGQELQLDKMMDEDQELRQIEEELLSEVEGGFEKKDKISCLLITYGLAVREKFYNKGFQDGATLTKIIRKIQGGIELRSVK